MLASFAILCCGDYGGVIAAQEIPVVVREVDRRVLLVDVGTEVGLITCVFESDWQSSQPFHSSEQRGRGLIWSSRDREQAGDGTTGGKRT